HPCEGEQAQQEAGGPRPGLRPGEDRGQGPQGPEVALRLRPDGRLRWRPDDPRPPRPQARVHQPVQDQLLGREPPPARRFRPRSHSAVAGRAWAGEQRRPRQGARRRRDRQAAHRGRPQVQPFGARQDRGRRRQLPGASLVIESFRNIFAIPDLRKRLTFTFLMLAVYRVGCFIPSPGVNSKALLEFIKSSEGTMLGFVNTFPGGSLSRVAVFALGIMPYITASIILQLLTVVWPYLEKLSKEGELGRRKITQYTRYGTVVISFVQALGIAFFLEKTPTPGGASLVLNPGWAFRLMTILTLTTGTVFVMWLGEQITERGIGNGISLIIFAGIIVGLPRGVIEVFNKLRQGTLSPIAIIVLFGFMLVVVAFIVYMERAQRRIPVQYAKRVMGRKVYGGQSTYLPLRVNTVGVIPVIFASSVVMVPSTLASFWPTSKLATSIADYVRWGQPLYY